MMTIDQVSTATLDQLTDELAAAGWDSTQTELSDAREAVARLIYSAAGPFDLIDSETAAVIRQATEAETIESVLAGPEGHIAVDGRRCYVAQSADIAPTEDQIRELGMITTRNNSGVHFTRWADHYEALEKMGLVAIHRPVHDATGIPYDESHWSIEVTAEGQSVVDQNMHLWP